MSGEEKHEAAEECVSGEVNLEFQEKTRNINLALDEKQGLEKWNEWNEWNE
jgi:hypothetical protein